MPQSDPRRGGPLKAPRLPLALLWALLPYAERDEVIAELRAELATRQAREGPRAARAWLWRQVLGSVPPLVRRTFSRGWTGFEPASSRLRPGGPRMESFIMDLRYAARRLRSRPTYVVLAVLTLALGVGGTAAAFGLVRGLLLTPLPYPAEERLDLFWYPWSWSEREFLFISPDWTGYSSVAAFRPQELPLRRKPDAPPELVASVATSAGLFDVLGVRPTLGRGFEPNEDRPGAAPAVVLSHALYEDLGAQPSLVGNTVELDGKAHTVVGVMPRGFWFPDPTVRAWVLETLNEEDGSGNYTLVGRRAPGTDGPATTRALEQIASRLRERFTYSPKWDKTKNAAVKPLRELLLGSLRPALLATVGAMGLILLIACANVAALMLGQVEGRGSELALRSALGAGRRRLTQQIVVEALLVGLGAGVLGAALAAAGFHALASALPIGAWAEGARLDWTTFAAALAIAVGAVLLVALVPSFSLWRGDLRGALGRARTGGIQGRGGRVERGLVVAEVALAMLIASGAALLVRSVANLYAIDPGIDTRGVAVVDVVSRLGLPAGERGRTVDELTAALGALPGARSAAAAMKIPLRGGGDSFGLAAAGRPASERTNTYFRVVSPAYFAAMGIAVRDGRAFDASDRPVHPDSTAAEISVVVNQALARKHFPGASPLGRYLEGGFDARQRIVGVVDDVAEAALTDGPEPTAYYLGSQAGWFGNRTTFVVRAARPDDAEALLDRARAVVNRTAPGFAVQEVTTMSRVFDTAVGPARQVMALLSLLSALALALGAVGIYGVISHFAARRKRDWAIRLALGLPASRVVRHIVGQGTGLVAAGIALGVAGTAALARLLATFLFGVGAVDPLALAGAAAALLAVGLVAAFVPARRAGAVAPATVLRDQ